MDDIALSELADHPVKGILKTVVVAFVDVGVNLGISSLLEAAFPAYSVAKNVWLGALEATVEITLHVTLSNMFLLFTNGALGGNNPLVPYGALVGLFLLSGAWQKLNALQRHLLNRDE